jgi:hypothetical protein
MNKKEKKEKEVENKAEKLNPQLQNILRKIKSVPEAKKEMRKLLAAGCDRTNLLGGLFASFGGSRGELQVGWVVAVRLRDELPKLAERLADDAERIESVFNDLGNVGNLSGVPEYKNLPSVLRELADTLRRIGRGVKTSLHHVKADRKSLRQLTRGRGHQVFELVCLLEEADVTQPYARLARLANAIRNEEEYDEVTAGALRKMADRYSKSATKPAGRN